MQKKRGTVTDSAALWRPAFLGELIDAMHQLEQQALLCSAYLGGTRRRSLKTFPFALGSRVQSEPIAVVAITHHRQKPGYWLQRH